MLSFPIGVAADRRLFRNASLRELTLAPRTNSPVIEGTDLRNEAFLINSSLAAVGHRVRA